MAFSEIQVSRSETRLGLFGSVLRGMHHCTDVSRCVAWNYLSWFLPHRFRLIQALDERNHEKGLPATLDNQSLLNKHVGA